MQNDKEKLQVLSRMTEDINEIKDLDTLLDRILTNVRQTLDADAGSIYLIRGNELIFSHTQNETLQKRLPPDEKLGFDRFTLPIDNRSIAGYVATNNEILNIHDVYQQQSNEPYKFDSAFDKASAYETHSMITVPLTNQRKKVISVMQIINAQDAEGRIKRFSEEDEALMRHFSTIAALAMERAQITRSVILRMAKMAEMRDPKETGPHVQRVAAFAVELLDRWAQMENCYPRETEREKEILRMAAILHDVGKVAISDTILQKPGGLTDAEFETIATHPCNGAALFQNMDSELDERAAEVALNHHEKWDGTGYPGHVDIVTGEPLQGYAMSDGKPRPKKGEEIPLSARIVALADVYDALRSKRAYKEAWREEEIEAEIRRCSGSQFDPDVVAAFFACKKNLEKIAATYPD